MCVKFYLLGVFPFQLQLEIIYTFLYKGNVSDWGCMWACDGLVTAAVHPESNGP